jgi:hypothetical protein
VILAEAGAVDATEDAQHGEARSDELPPELIEPVERRKRLRRAQQELESRAPGPRHSDPARPPVAAGHARDRLLEDWQLVHRVEAERARVAHQGRGVGDRHR